MPEIRRSPFGGVATPCLLAVKRILWRELVLDAGISYGIGKFTVEDLNDRLGIVDYGIVTTDKDYDPNLERVELNEDATKKLAIQFDIFFAAQPEMITGEVPGIPPHRLLDTSVWVILAVAVVDHERETGHRRK